ncbi:hypothetical protein HYX14_02280 [Candidatus Woesearchaeota archaeon]|nr:hypothetical protein [Candidatus Woesearchaeota archaeon]
MKQIIQKPYWYWLLGIFIIYIGLNVYISEFYITAQYLSTYANQIHWGKLILGMVFTVVIGALVSVNMVSGYIRWKERQQIKKSGALACAGTIGGLATGVCSSCVTSVFPLVLGLFGVSFSWVSLPFQGLEVQVLMIGLLAGSLWWMGK